MVIRNDARHSVRSAIITDARAEAVLYLKIGPSNGENIAPLRYSFCYPTKLAAVLGSMGERCDHGMHHELKPAWHGVSAFTETIADPNSGAVFAHLQDWG